MFRAIDSLLRHAAFWLVWRGPVNLRRFAPAVFAYAIRAREWREVTDDGLDSAD
jgi:hypothetical protein